MIAVKEGDIVTITRPDAPPIRCEVLRVYGSGEQPSYELRKIR